jgi:hypothetical protein
MAKMWRGWVVCLGGIGYPAERRGNWSREKAVRLMGSRSKYLLGVLFAALGKGLFDLWLNSR